MITMPGQYLGISRWQQHRKIHEHSRVAERQEEPVVTVSRLLREAGEAWTHKGRNAALDRARDLIRKSGLGEALEKEVEEVRTNLARDDERSALVVLGLFGR